jgi:hypothetical protein
MGVNAFLTHGYSHETAHGPPRWIDSMLNWGFSGGMGDIQGKGVAKPTLW